MAVPAVESLFQDLRFTARSLRRSPGFAVVAVLTLAIGIGATTALFSTVNATILRPLPYAQPENLVNVSSYLTTGQVTTGRLSPVNLGLFKPADLPIDSATGFLPAPNELTYVTDEGTPTNLLGTGVSEGFFDVLGLPLSAGPGFAHEDHAFVGPGAQAVGILSYRVWTSMFGRDPAIVGKILRVVEIPSGILVKGVAPPELDLPHGTEVWLAARLNPQDIGHGLDVIVRAKPGTDIDALRERADVLLVEQGKTSPTDATRRFIMKPLGTAIVGDLGPMLLIVLGATALLLLLACVNVMNLLLARGTVRLRELAIRSALGAGRGQLVRQMLTESVVLSVLGTVAGLGLAAASVRMLLAYGASALPRLDAVPFDTTVLLFAVGVTVFSALVMGLAPAWRLAKVDVRTLLNDSGRSASPGRATSRWMSGLIVAEVALAIVLTAGAGWLVQSFQRLGAVNPGFVPEGKLVMTVRPGRTFDFRKPDEVFAWADEVFRRVRDVPGVAVAGGAGTFPTGPNRDGTLVIELRGEPSTPEHRNSAHVRTVSVDFFEAMGVKVIAGRTFTDGDRRDTRPVAVVNREFVKRFLHGLEPLTTSFAYGLPEVDLRTMRDIVGVVDDMPYESLALPPGPVAYLVQAQQFPLLRPTIVVQPKTGDPRALESGIRASLTQFDPLIMLNFTTAPEILGATLDRQRLGMTLMLIFGGLALTLAAIGIYGVIAYASTQRRGEFATRIALGASGRQVFGLVLSAGQKLAIAGVVIGLVGAYAGGRVVASRVYGMSAADPVILLAAAVIVGVVALLATMIPAARASRIDPVRALRTG